MQVSTPQRGGCKCARHLSLGQPALSHGPAPNLAFKHWQLFLGNAAAHHHSPCSRRTPRALPTAPQAARGTLRAGFAPGQLGLPATLPSGPQLVRKHPLGFLLVHGHLIHAAPPRLHLDFQQLQQVLRALQGRIRGHPGAAACKVDAQHGQAAEEAQAVLRGNAPACHSSVIWTRMCGSQCDLDSYVPITM